MPGGIRDLLLHPDAFFERVAQEKVNLAPPLLILGVGVAIHILVILLVVSGFSRSGYSVDFFRIGGLQRDVFLTYVLRSILVPLGQWAFVSLVAYGICRAFSGRGSLSATVQNVGYGMLPWTLSMIIPVVLFTFRFATDTHSGPFSGIWLTDPYACSIIAMVVTLWSSCLWIFAIRHTHGFSVEKATGVTIVSVAGSWGVFMALSYIFEGVKMGFIPVF